MALAAIWTQLLKVERVGRQDNFFALGGHSLLAVRATAASSRIGIEISITDLFTHPTIESLARKAISACAAADQAIPIRKDGTQPPLYFTHCGYGELLYIYALLPYLDANIPIYALPAPSPGKPQLQTVEGMASRMVQMINSVQPNGPYRIPGWSFGGMLAYEITMQLIGSDQEVGFLGMLDTYYPLGIGDFSRNTNLDTEENEQLLLLIQYLAYLEGKPISVHRLKSSMTTLDFPAFVQKCRHVLLMPEALRDYAPGANWELLARIRSFETAANRYVAQPLPVPVHFFTAREAVRPGLAGGWNAVVPRTLLRVFDIAGNHQSMLKSPNVESLGEMLSRQIRNAIGERPAIQSVEKRELPFITLHPGRGQTGEGLFCVPGAGATVISLFELAASLSTPWPIFGLQTRGVDGLAIPHTTVSAASQFYMRIMDEVFPKGRIHLLGHSFGGWVALDMAQRLLDAGREVASLSILDSESPDSSQSPVPESTGRTYLWRWLNLSRCLSGIQSTSLGKKLIQKAKSLKSNFCTSAWSKRVSCTAALIQRCHWLGAQFCCIKAHPLCTRQALPGPRTTGVRK